MRLKIGTTHLEKSGCKSFFEANIYLLFLLFFVGCSKSGENSQSVICNNPDAINYKKQGNCTFPKDSIISPYNVIVTDYQVPCSANINGTSMGLKVQKDVCIGFHSDSSYKVLNFSWLGSLFDPEGFCVKLTDGYNFSITADQNVTWAGASVTGSGNFLNGKFTFIGTVQSICGDWALKLDGVKQ